MKTKAKELQLPGPMKADIMYALEHEFQGRSNLKIFLNEMFYVEKPDNLTRVKWAEKNYKPEEAGLAEIFHEYNSLIKVFQWID